MSIKYKVEQISYTALVLDEGYSTSILLEEGNKSITGRRLPRLGTNNFAYDGVDKYRFGCQEGKFNYAQLLTQIKAGEESMTKEVDALLPIKGGNAITTEVIEESEGYYILKGGKAVAKANYIRGKTKPKDPESSFGAFIRKKDTYWGTNNYNYRNNDVGGSKSDIMDALYQAKAIIDFFEDKGDYAPVVEEKVEEVFAS